MFFRLNNFTYLIDGQSCSLYDMKKNKYYLLDNESSDIVRYCENNLEVESINDYYLNKDSIMNLLHKLTELNLGDIYDMPVHIDKFRNHAPLLPSMYFVPNYMQVFMEITNKCNLNCKFCGNKNVRTWLGCLSCVRIHEKSNNSCTINIDDVLEQLITLEVKELIIRGGEPLLEKELLKHILNSLKEKKANIKITIVTPGTGMSIDEILNLYELNENICLNIVFFGAGENKYEQIMGSPDIYKRQCKLVDEIKKHSLKFTITNIVDSNVSNDVEGIINHIKKSWNVVPSIVEVVDLNCNECKLSNVKINVKFLAEMINNEEFFFRQEYNTCLYGKFSIDLNGDIYPCPHIKSKIGSLIENSLPSILSNEKLYEYWRLNKNRISNCRECSMKIFCSDCSVFEVDAELHDKYCPYNSNQISDISKLNFIPNNIIKKITINNTKGKVI